MSEAATAAVRRTPLYDEHVAAGARMVEFAGWSMPVQYHSILAEHHAVRRAAGLFDVSHMGEFEITGPAAEELCSTLFTNDVRTLAPGRAQYSMIGNDAGGVVDDIIVYRLGAQQFYVCVNASNAAKDLAWIRERAIAGATIEDRSDRTALIAIQGPMAAGIVQKLEPGVAGLPRFGCGQFRVGGADALVARTGYTGEDGFELFCAADAAVTLWRALLEAGRESDGTGLLCCGLGARDTLRVEAALPLYGHELGSDISPYEVGLGWAVKPNRPSMVGYESFVRAAAGGVTRQLVGLLVDGGIARESAAVFAATSAPGPIPEGSAGAAIGTITSGTHSPTLGRPIAMALLARAAVAALPLHDGGARVEVEIRGKRRAAFVTRLPFYVKRRAS